jgi:hypothetical protein
MPVLSGLYASSLTVNDSSGHRIGGQSVRRTGLRPTPLQSAGHTESLVYRDSIVRRPLSASTLIHYNLRP